MGDAFDRFQGTDSAKGDAFDRFPVSEESFGKNAFRTAAQVPLGIAEATAPGIAASLFQFLAAGETDLSFDEWRKLREVSEKEGKPFDEEGYEGARQQLLSSIPTVSNLSRMGEEATGIPLEAKTKLQKSLKLGSSAGKFAPGTIVQKGSAAIAAPAVSQTLQSIGLPEGVSDIAGLGISPLAASKAPAINIKAKTKTSGLTTKQFEKLKSPREVSESTIGKINTKIENEFRDISDKIIGQSPIKETYQNLKNDVTFKQKSIEGFEKVNELAESFPNKFKTSDITKKLMEDSSNKKTKGITPSEFDKKHNGFIEDFVKDTPDGVITTADLVAQYRKNNKSLGQAFEPGQSFAHNNAKREALLDYNKTIADVIENEHPNSEFSNLFIETNKKWTEISDAEAINKFLDSVFDGKIQFHKGKEFFDKQGMTVPFKRALGKEGYANFETLMVDLMSYERASKLLKQAQAKGFSDLAKTGLSYLVHPNVAGAKIGYDLAKGLYKRSFEMLLDKPQMAITWDRGVNAMKSGNFQVAQKEFSKLQNEVDPRLLKAKNKALTKFNQNQKI